jgi:hypothetical protein
LGLAVLESLGAGGFTYFQFPEDSTSISATPPVATPSWPTATQLLADVQVTASKLLPVDDGPEASVDDAGLIWVVVLAPELALEHRRTRQAAEASAAKRTRGGVDRVLFMPPPLGSN